MSLKLVKTLTGHNARVKCLALFPDKIHLASVYDGITVKIWDIKNSELIKT